MFTGQDTYDTSVSAGEIVYLLDASDPGWFWVRKLDNSEGYVPSNYIVKIKDSSRHERRKTCQGLEPNLGNTNQHHIQAEVEIDQNRKAVTDESEMPIQWKLTNELTGKTTVSVIETTDMNDKKRRPKKPPRKKKSMGDGISTRLDDSMDSVDSCITGSSIEYLDQRMINLSYGDMSPRSNVFSDSSVLDHMSPRSNVFSDSSVFESNYSETYSVNDSDIEIQPSRNKSSVVQQQQHNNTNTVERHVSAEQCQGKLIHGHKHKRPVSMPACRSYEEHNKDYFDEYFYEDNDIKFADRPKHNVVNVSEILKMRSAREHLNETKLKQNVDIKCAVSKTRSAKEHITHTKAHVDRENKTEDSKPKIKQFLLDLPPTPIHNKKESKNKNYEKTHPKNVKANHKTNCDENTNNARVCHSSRDFHDERPNKARNYHSSSDLQDKRQIKARNFHSSGHSADERPNKVKNYHSSSDLRNAGKEINIKNDRLGKENMHPINNSCNKVVDKHTKEEYKSTHTARQYNSETDLRNTCIYEQKKNERNAEINTMNHAINKTESHLNLRTPMAHQRAYSSTDLREIDSKPDWSFGYPRKSRHSIGRVEYDNQTHHGKHIKSGKHQSNIDSRRETKGHEPDRKLTRKQAIEASQNNRTKEHVDSQNRRKKHEAPVENLKYTSDIILSEESLDNETMNNLLSQTDNLLHKTNTLLDEDGVDQTDQGNYGHDRRGDTFLVGGEDNHEAIELYNEDKDNEVRANNMVETCATDKCNQFLRNRTIGIHGMTYFVTEESNINDTFNNTTSSKSLGCSNGQEHEFKDSRKEKSSVMKDKSSDLVFAELKTLDLRDIRGITEFVSQCDYNADTDNVLSMVHGEIVHVGLDGQDTGEWYWAFSPRLRKYGFVPKLHVKIPMVTII